MGPLALRTLQAVICQVTVATLPDRFQPRGHGAGSKRADRHRGHFHLVYFTHLGPGEDQLPVHQHHLGEAGAPGF